MSHGASVGFWSRPPARLRGAPGRAGRGAREQLLLPARARARAHRLHALRPRPARPPGVPHRGEPPGLLRRPLRGVAARRPPARHLGALARALPRALPARPAGARARRVTRRAASRTAAAPRRRRRPPASSRGGFFLSVGTLEPRKNLRRLLAAFARVTAEGGHRRCRWCSRAARLAGGRPRALRRFARPARTACACWATWTTRRCAGCTPAASPSPTRRSSRASACRCWRRCRLGAAVVTSDRSSLPEVAGDAALAVDPTDEAGARRRAAPPGGRAGPARPPCVARAVSRARSFSWTAAARQTLELYRLALALPPRAAEPVASGQL